MATAIGGKLDAAQFAELLGGKGAEHGPLPKDAGMQALGALMQGLGKIGHKDGGDAGKAESLADAMKDLLAHAAPGSFHKA